MHVSTGKVGVCMATSGPGATNLVTTIADAKMDSIPLVVITGQVSTAVIGSDAFQETPIVEVCRSVTKHHYLVTDVNDLARVFKEAFHVATTGRKGPVLIDLPKDVQLDKTVPDYDAKMNLPGYRIDDPRALPEQIAQAAAAIRRAKQPVIYAGGGIISSDAADELTKLAKKTNIPVATTLTGLGGFPGDHELALGMVGMHGTAYSNLTLDEADLLLALGVRFDDRVTGKVSEFVKHGKIVHIDIDPSEINKVKAAHIPIVSDLKYALAELNKVVEPPQDLSKWHKKIDAWKKSYPMKYDVNSEHILPQQAIAMLSDMTKDLDPIIATGVGQHQMWTSQFFKYRRPRRSLTSAGLGTMGFGLPAAMGAKAANPEKLVVDIDGDGSFQMNIQEMGTCHCEKLPVQGAFAQQYAPGHGRAVGRPLQRRQSRAHIPGPHRPSRGRRPGKRHRSRSALSRLRDNSQRLRLERAPHLGKGRTCRCLAGNDRFAFALSVRRASPLPGTRAAHDPGRIDRQGFDLRIVEKDY